MTAYPAIRKACLLISYSNGGVNRYRTERQAINEMDIFLSSLPYNDQFATINAWLDRLSTADLETVCDGDQHDAEKIMTDAPAFTDRLLNDYFEEIC